MDNNYDQMLREIELFKLHPTYIPYIGKNYDTYKILHVGESHYIGQDPNNEKFDICYFENWWSDPCQELFNEYPDWFNTRAVMSNYMQGKCGESIFTNFIKSFSKVVLDKQIDSITLEDKSLYEYVAFMNFFQMPSIYEGMKFWDALEIAGRKEGQPELAGKMWDMAVENSVKTIDRVIEILEPRAIVFTSISAGNAYKAADSKFKNDSRIIFTAHPGYPYTWQKNLSSLDGKKGIEVFEEGLERIYRIL